MTPTARSQWTSLFLATLIGLVSSRPALAFDLGPTKWCANPVGDRANDIPYQLVNNWPGGNSGDQAQAVSLGRDQWNRQNRELNYHWTGSVQPWVAVKYENLLFPNQDALAVAITHTWGPNCLLQADIIFNHDPDWWWGAAGALWFWADDWFDHPPGDKWDARSLASHEFGHLVMLDHVPGSGSYFERDSAVMYGYFDSGVERWVLRQDDKNGLNAWYPPK